MSIKKVKLGINDMEIVQDDNYFCFGMDTILLANFVISNSSKNVIVDFCSGTGVIPIIISAKQNYKRLYAVELQEEIENIAGAKFYTDRIDLKLNNKAEIKPILDKAKTLTKVASYNVTDIDTKDGVKLMLGNKTKILVRPSGTEPLLRIYFETDSVEKLEELKKELKF